MTRLLSAMVVVVVVVLACASVVAAMLPVPYFGQYDSQWSNDGIYVDYNGGVVSAEDVSVDFTGSVADAKIQAAFAEDKIQSLSSQTEIFVGQGFDKCEIPTLSQMQNWITNSPYGAVNLYIGGSCRSCPNSVLTASYVSQLSQQGWKFIPTWVGPQSACWGGSCGSIISNDPATAYNQGISEANAAIDVAIDLGLALADGSGTIIYYDLEVYDTTNTACRNAAKSFISGWTAQLHARGSEAGVYGSACGSAISDFASISNVPDAIWPAHWIYSSYNSGATVWDVACLSNGLWVNHQRIRQYAGGHDETWGGVTLNIDCNVIDGIVASVGPADIIPLSGDLYGDGKDITGTFNPSTNAFTFKRNEYTPAKTVIFGIADDLPVIGDWGGNDNGKDEIGIYRPDDGGQSTFHLVTRDWASLPDNAGAADNVIPFGPYPANIPIAGDWDGDGDDDIGGFNPGNNKFYLYILDLGTESATSYKDVPFGISGDDPIIGDWDGDGDDDVGVYREFDSNYGNNLVFYFDLDFSGDHADLTPIPLGNNGDVAVIGDWDDDGDDDVGLYRAGTFIIDPDFNVPHDLVYLDDGIVKVGVDLEWGGAISVIMHQGMNLIDNHDTGRLAQVAFYNDDSGTWDPVQGGDRFNQGSPVLDYNKGTNVIYTKTQPRDWNTSVLTDTYVEQWVSLEGQSVKVQYKFTHFGTDTYTFHDQEFPCAYINTQLHRLITYTNSNPWTNDGVNEFSIPQTDPGTPNTEFYPTEYWASFVNDLGFGLTLYSPDHTSKWAAHRFTCDTKPGYLATVDQFAIVPGTVEEATEYFIVGNYPDARNIVYSLESSQPPTVITVDDDGPADYNNIQAAVDAASDGDTIEVRSGTYVENVNVDKRLTLVGDGADVVTVQAANASDHVFEVTADYVTVHGFTVTGAVRAGIYVRGSGAHIFENVASNNDFGISLEGASDNRLTSNRVSSNNCCGIGLWASSSNNLITNNSAASNSDFGIALWESSNNTLADNRASNNNYGIALWEDSSSNTLISNVANSNMDYGFCLCGASNNQLINNTMLDNRLNLRVDGFQLSHFIHSIDTSNSINGRPIEYIVDRHGLVIDSSWDIGYLGLVNCTDITVKDLTITNNSDGILLAYSTESEIENLNVSSNHCGIKLLYSSNNKLNNNIADDYIGVYLGGSCNNVLTNNTVLNNMWGIALSDSSGNIIFLNDWMDNSRNAYLGDLANNWNSPEKITYTYNGNTYTNYLGNYWDDYTNVDADSDGIWDNPYNIDSNNQDDYPLKERFENYIEQPPSLNGKIVFHSNRDNNFEIYIMDADGTNQTRLTRNAGNDHYAVWSPDGAKIAFTSEKDGNEEIYVMNPNGTNQNRLTYNSASDWVPDFSPDGKKIAFTSNRDGNSEVYIMNSEGGNQTRLTENNADDRDPDWSITNKIAFESNRDGNPEIYLMDADGNNVIRLTHNSAVDRHPAWSSDGSKIVFTSDRDGNDEIYVMNADGSNQMRVTYSSASDLDPVWSPDENYFVFATNRTGNYEIYRMDMDGSNQTRLTVNTNEDYRPDWGLPASIPNYPPNPPTNLKQFKSDSTTEIPVGGTTNERTVIFKGTVSDPDGDMVKLQVELRRLDEYGGQFDETKGGLKDSGFVASGSEAVAYAEELIDADYHWRARAVDEHGDSSAWQEFGGNDISDVDFVVKVNNRPHANAGSPYYGNVNESIQFHGSATGGTPPYTYVWEFVDIDTAETVIGQNPTHTWSTVGLYSAQLRVQDSAGLLSEPNVCVVYVVKPFTFVQVTDVHIGCKFDDVNPWCKNPTEMSIGWFTSVINGINKLTPEVDFVLVTGDLVESDKPDFFYKFMDVLTRLDSSIRFYHIPGNHDRYTSYGFGDDLTNYHDCVKKNGPRQILIGPDNYTFEYGGYTFIGLDSGADVPLSFPYFWGTGLTEPQINGLRAFTNLEAPKIIFMHHPVFNDYSFVLGVPYFYWGVITHNREPFITYCQDNKVHLVLTGHTHEAKIFNADGKRVGWDSNDRPLFIQTGSVTEHSECRVIEVNSYDDIFIHPSTDQPICFKKSIWSDGSDKSVLHVYDSQGRHTGIDGSGNIVNEISHSYYIGNYGPMKLEGIILYDATEDYKLTVTLKKGSIVPLTTNVLQMQQPENQSFNLTITNQTGDSLTSISYNNVTFTENTIATVYLNRTAVNYTMAIDYNGDNITDETKDPDSLETDYAPTATINFPVNNSIYLYGDEIPFNGMGIDVEDGILTNSSLVWSSNSYGFIGVGCEFNTTNLTTGTHIIELTVNDSSGQIGMENVTITVIAPDLAIDASNISFSNPDPIDGESITINATIHNIGTANANSVTVQFFDDNPANGTQIGANQTIASLNVREHKTVSVAWNTTGEAGDNGIWIVVDPSDSIKEPDEGNNQANKSIFVDAPDVLHILNAQTDSTVYLGYEAVLINCTVQNASGNISANVSADIEKPDGIIDNITLIEGLIGNYNGAFTNTSISGIYSITIYANRTGFVGDTESLNFEILDTTPPASITNITHTIGSTWINWTWDNPLDPDFEYTLIYLNGTWNTITAKGYHLVEGLDASTEYEMGTQTVDAEGNMNENWVNQTARTSEIQLPIANFAYTPENPVVTQLITFNASNSTDPDGFITNYEWNFGDGNITNTTEPIITHSYASTGVYTVNLTVTDNDGATNTTTKLITVTNLCGDVAPYPNCDGTVDMGDVILLLNNVSYPENPRYTLGNDWSGDCRCTGVRDMGDVILLLNNVSYPENPIYALDCC